MADLPDEAYGPIELSPESEACIREILQSKDTDESGYINKTELGECLYAIGFCPTKEDVIFLQNQFDINNDGRLEISELLKNIHIINAHSVNAKELTSAFKTFDINGDGFIRLPELRTILMANDCMSVEEASKLLDHLVKTYDANHDGKFDYPEFVQMVMSDAFKPNNA